MYNPNNFPYATMPSADPLLLHPFVFSLYQEHLRLCALDPVLSTYQIKAIATLRTTAYQNLLYEQGRSTPGKIVTNAKGGSSLHNYGLAYDIGIFDGTKNLTGTNAHERSLYVKAAEIGKSIGLLWGGDWISIKDYPHFQYLGGLSDSEALALLRDGETVDNVIGKQS